MNSSQNGSAPPRITVFTPTYNRAYTLRRLYESLESQTFKDFEWLVVDDGSTDETKELIADLSKGASFPVVYIHKENGGIHTAYNAATPLARGEYFMVIGSDDTMLPDCLKTALRIWDEIPEGQRKELYSVCGLCQDQNGNLVGTEFPKDRLRSNSLALRYKYKVRGDKSSLVRTQILRDNPFPETERSQSLFEEVIWFKIAREYDEIYVNELFQVKHLDTVSITRGNLPDKYAYSGMLTEREFLNCSLTYFWMDPLAHLKKAANYRRNCLHSGVSSREAVSKITNRWGKVLAVMGAIPGRLKYKQDLEVIRLAKQKPSGIA